MVLIAGILLTLFSCLESPAIIKYNYQIGSSIFTSSCDLELSSVGRKRKGALGWQHLLKWMRKEERKKQGKGEMGQLRPQGGRSCLVNGKLRVEEKGQDE